MAPEPIHQIRSDGTAVLIGEWIHDERRLILEHRGFPLLGPGDHRLDSDLPWVFWDMCPSGYLARGFIQRAATLALPHDQRLWTARDCLSALANFGDDLSGNLIIGSRSIAAWKQITSVRRSTKGVHLVPLQQAEALQLDHVELPRDPNDQSPSSSLGGERPKRMIWGADGADWLAKFSPPTNQPFGVRWSDLLRVEAHCARVLNSNGIDAVVAGVTERNDRTWLMVRRFDRHPGFGRSGATTLYWYAGGDPTTTAPNVIGSLVQAGHLRPETAVVVQRVHEFSRAIGNNDAHLGNYGLSFDDEGDARVSPFYDILPMALAPRGDELPDDRVASVRPSDDPVVQRWVAELVGRVASDPRISREFLDLWLRVVRH